MSIYKSDEIGEVVKALAVAYKTMGKAGKSAENPFFKSKYADLATIWDTCSGPLLDAGITPICTIMESTPDQVTVRYALHVGEQWISSTLTLKPTKPDPQGIGSAITYARRYTLACIAGVMTEDDDGQAASKPAPVAKVSPKKEFAKLLTGIKGSMPTKNEYQYIFGLLGASMNIDGTVDDSEVVKSMAKLKSRMEKDAVSWSDLQPTPEVAGQPLDTEF